MKFFNFNNCRTASKIFAYYCPQSQRTGRVDHLAVEIYKGALYFSINVGSETLKASLGRALNDGQPHKVSISIVNLRVGVAVDDGQCGFECIASLAPSGGGGELELNGALYVGGVGPRVTPYMVSKLKTTENFIGCLEVNVLIKLKGHYVYLHDQQGMESECYF